MSKLLSARYFNFLLIVIIFAAGGVGFFLGSRDAMTVTVLRHYPWDLLSQEVSTMGECVECHEAQDFHTCQTCHDDHGAIELTEVPFYNLVMLTGDVPQPGFVEVNEILPYRDHPNTMITVKDFLAGRGINEFDQLTLFSDDGGMVTIQKSELTDRAYFLPYMDGIRFACEDLHVSTWLKGIRKIVVVGSSTPLTIDGQPTSLGRLLMGPERAVTVEAANVMLVSEVDGQIRKAVTALRLQGVGLAEWMDFEDTREIQVVDQSGAAHLISIEEAQTGILVPIQGVLTLVLQERGRSFWIEDVVRVEKIK